MHKLEVDGVFLEFDNRRILSDVYLKCETGKIIGLLGRNGNGKTSLMNIIYENLNPKYKSVRFDDITELAAYKKPHLLLYLPQFNFIPKQLNLKRIFKDYSINFSDFENYLPQFKNREKTAFKNLSGGERRLTELYIIIKSKTRFVILDEPFSHLSPIQIDTIKELILEEKLNKGFLITDHMYKHVIDISNDIYVLAGGKTHHTKDIKEIEFLGYAKIS
jgi:ABC-type lipopolysaccharide export system ATPase subunit